MCAECLLGLREQSINIGLLRNIGLDRDRLPACALDFARDLIGVILGSRVIDYYVRAFLRERLCDSGAYALRCARNYCGFSR